MKKESMRILSIILLSVILISLIAGIVATQNEEANKEAATQAGKSIAEKVTDWWNSSTFNISDQSKTLLSKILLTILVILIIYSVVGFLPFVPAGKDYINWLIAIIMGVLSFMFVSADNIKYILMNYEALGVILTSILPLVVLLTFSYRLRLKSPGVANILNPALFIGFLLYVGSKWLAYKPSVDTFLGTELQYVYPLTFILTVIWLVLERRISHYFLKKELLGDVEKFRTMNKIEIAGEISKLEDLKKYVSDPKFIELMDKRQDELNRIITRRGPRGS